MPLTTSEIKKALKTAFGSKGKGNVYSAIVENDGIDLLVDFINDQISAEITGFSGNFDIGSYTYTIANGLITSRVAI